MKSLASHIGFVMLSLKQGNNAPKFIVNLNTITTVGFQCMASHHAANAPGKRLFDYVAFGDGVALAESENNLALESEIYREAFDDIFASGVTMFGSTTIIATDIGDSSYTIGEIGLYDAVSGGNLIARQLLPAANIIENFTGADRLDVLWGVVNV